MVDFHGRKKFSEALPGNRFARLHEVAVGCEFGDERGGGKAHAGDTAVVAFGGPASAAAVGRELLRGVLASFLDECGFERFELFVFHGDVAVKGDGFSDEFAERSFVSSVRRGECPAVYDTAHSTQVLNRMVAITNCSRWLEQQLSGQIK